MRMRSKNAPKTAQKDWSDVVRPQVAMHSQLYQIKGVHTRDKFVSSYGSCKCG